MAVPGLVLVLLASACSTTDSGPVPDTTARPPEQSVPYSQVWSAEPGIDLFSRGAELIRASVEAGNYASYYSLGTTFPGYSDAVGGPMRFDRDKILPALVPDGRGSNEPKPRTIRYHIATLVESPSELIADVCDRREHPTERTASSTSPVGFAWVVKLSNSAGRPGRPGIPDADPDSSDPRALRVPDWNVFGEWRITELHAGGRNWTGSAPHECTDWWLQRSPGSYSIPDGNVLMPAGAVIPGAPVAPQYPEWIGPDASQ
ncbi:MAG: hypothetical protein WAX14_12285 [Rhodococcus sp. (in: high G+C Gram-positive bacteria)]|uniref:hypothetical protein n=1 Tax=Rhodococcus sp. TaxID=1831 RepID=UPI003BB774FD